MSAVLEKLMNPGTYQYPSDFARKYIARGKAEGMAQTLLKLLHVKGLAVPTELAARVESCQEFDQLDRWIERVLSATVLGDVARAA